jgi:hypothetical protein
MTYYQDLGRIAQDLITRLVALSQAAALGGIVPGIGTPAQTAARAELAATLKTLPSEDRQPTVQAAVSAGGNAAELQRALDAANAGMSLGVKLAIGGGVLVGAYLLLGRRRRRNPSTFTRKGERMYRHIERRYAGRARAKEIAARTVYARSRGGAPGLVKRRRRR